MKRQFLVTYIPKKTTALLTSPPVQLKRHRPTSLLVVGVELQQAGRQAKGLYEGHSLSTCSRIPGPRPFMTSESLWVGPRKPMSTAV